MYGFFIDGGSGDGVDSVAVQNMQDEKREFVADSGITDANYLKNSMIIYWQAAGSELGMLYSIS